MGLKQLEWHEQRGGGWVARISYPRGTNADLIKVVYYRFAHVDIYPFHIKRIKNKVLVDMQRGAPEHIWHDSVDAAKLYVEAIFALRD